MKSARNSTKSRLAVLISTATLTLGCATTAALTPHPLVVGDLEALTVLDALPEDATGIADTTRDLFTALNTKAGALLPKAGALLPKADGLLPMMTLLRVENTVARGVLRLDPSAVVIATSGLRGN